MTELSTGISRPDSAATASRIRWVLVVQAAILLLLTYWVYRAPIGAMVHKWQRDGNWSHGWLVPVFSLYFVAVHRQAILADARRGSYLGVLVVVAALALFYLSLLKRFGYPQQFSLIPCLMGLVLMVGGWGVLKHLWFPIAYLLFAIPLPPAIYFQVTLPLRKLASAVGGAVLGLLPDVFTEVQGVVIDYMYLGKPGTLNVEEACSGMRLMMAFCALGVAMAYLGDRPLWHRVIMVIACIPIAVFCNTVRVVTTGILQVYGLRDLAQGTAGELLGLLMLPIALGLFALVGYVLKNLFVDDGASAETQD